MRQLPLLALAATLLACASAPPAPPPRAALAPLPARAFRQAGPVVLRHATVLPASGPAIPDGAVAFADGRIVAVGPDAAVATPPGARVVDVAGRFVSPGVVDAHSHAGVYPAPGARGNLDGNEMTGPITAEVSAEHAFWPQDPNLSRALAAGVTSLLVLPGSANVVGGRGFPVKLHPGRTPREMRFPGAPELLKMACGENPPRVYGRERKLAPMTRMASAAILRQALADARDYQARQAAWGEKARRGPAEAGAPPRRELRLETLAAALRGELLVQLHCYRADDIETMLRVADEAGLAIRAVHHGLEAYKVRDLLAARGVAVATWPDWWGFKMEAWDGIPEAPALLARAGVRVAIHSDSPYAGQRLPQDAGKALHRAREAGLAVSDEEAIRWVTLHPAWIMGVDRLTGSLEPGKMADVVVWSRHPLSAYARAELVFVDGVLEHDARAAPRLGDFELAAAPPEAPAAPAGPGAAGPALGALCGGGADPACLPLPVEQARCTAFAGATLATEGRVEADATVVVEAGRVARVGGGAPPAGCRVVEARGRLLAPGLVLALSQLGLVEVMLEEEAGDAVPRGEEREAVRAALRAADSLNPASALFPVARLGGLTAALAAPEGGLLSGQSALIATDGSLLASPAAMHAHLGGPGARAVGSTRGGALERLREVLDDARAYGRRRGDFEQNRMRKVAASRLDLEALQPVLEGKLPLVVHAHRQSDLRAALRLAAEEKLRLVLAGATEGWRLAAEIARAGVPVIVDPAGNLPSGFDRLEARPDNAARLAAAGAEVILAPLVGDAREPHMARTLPAVAGQAVAWGLPWADAFRAVTSAPARAFGLDAGRVAAGARADLVLWSGDPLEIASRPLAMWIGGKQVPLWSRQQELRERYRSVP